MEAIFLVLVVLLIGVGISVFLWKSKVDKDQSDEIRDLERRLTDLIIGQLKEIRTDQNGVSRAMQDQIASFTKEATQIKDELKLVQESVKDVSTFQQIFKAPKLRGQWGEASLEHILSEHFPGELCKFQYLFSSGEQVDAVLCLPNGRILPIDSKFPSENFARMAEAGSGEEKSAFQKKFIEDVKDRVDEITLKYVLPSEGTTEFALMYIPAEAVYYELINNIGRNFDLTQYAWSKKIILTSPNTIYLTLRTIEHWFKDTQISRKTQEILKRLGKINQDASKLMTDFRKMGSHLRNTVSAYDSSEKRLSLFSDKVEKLLETPRQNRLDEEQKEKPKKLK